jgi:hypothetical protein
MTRRDAPLRHPTAKTWVDNDSNHSHFGDAAQMAFSHAEYTFRNFFKPEDYLWMALACCERGGVSRDVIRNVARTIGVDLQEPVEDTPSCTGTLMHSEYTRCPVHDD